MSVARIFLVLSSALILCACAAKPVLYPNQRLQEVGEARAGTDIRECMALAESHGVRRASGAEKAATSTAVGGGVGAASGAVGGAVVGNVGTGAAVGAATGATAGLIHGLFAAKSDNPAYRGFVERCLRERGYEVVGWQ